MTDVPALASAGAGLPMRPLPPDPATSLAAQVHAAAVDDDLVFLDIGRDAYVCIPRGAVVARLTGDRRGLHLSSPAVLGQLREAGLVGDGSGAPEAWRPPLLPTQSALPPSNPAPGWRDVPDILAVLADVVLLYWRRPFSAVLANARARRPTPRRTCWPLNEVVARFHGWIPYAPVPGKCLLRSFMLLRLLQRHGHDARWVFAVATWPFLAHCWLQVDALVLDDDVERLAGLHPILVV